jgi:hypothetical protein
MMSEDPTDAPVPLAATLRRQGLMGAEDRITVLSTPPPVKPEKRPGLEFMELDGKQVPVFTTPPPPRRRHEADTMDRPGPSDAELVADAVASLVTPPPKPLEDAAESRAPAFAAIAAVLVLLGTFAALLMFGNFS